jgi:general secretion pathway protein J
LAAKRARKAERRGFTLVELLVAISVLAIVAVLGWRGLDGIVRARIALTREMAQARGLQLAFAQMQRDFTQIAPIAILSGLPQQGRVRVAVEPERVVLVRTVYADGQPTRVQVVAYTLTNGALTRRESAATRDLNTLDILWMTVTDGNAKQAVTLQTGVVEMKVRAWKKDGQGWRDGGLDIDVPQPNAMTGTSPPLTGLEISLRLEGRANAVTKTFMLGAV